MFILGFSYLKSTPIFDTSKTLYAVFDDVGGLQTGTQVSINGFGVGTVQHIGFKDNSGKLVVTFTAANNFQFSSNSEAELFDTGIIGGKGLQIKPVFDQAPMARSGDTLRAAVRPGLTDLLQTRLTPLQLKVEGAVTNADSLMMNVNDILDYNTRNDLRQSILALKNLMHSLQGSADLLHKLLEGNKGKLDSSLTNFKAITENLADISDSLNRAGLGTTMTRLGSVVANLDNVMLRLEKGEGTLGKVLTNEELFDNLNSASRELDLLLQDFRLNPKRYVHVSVFGKKQQEYELPENDPAEIQQDR